VLPACRRGAAARGPRLCSALTQIITASVLAVTRRAGPGDRRSCRTESGRAPPCMRWRDPARPRRIRWPVAWPGRHRAPPAGARYPREGPVSRFLPTSRVVPRWCPFPNGESISTASASAAQDPAATHFGFVRYPQRNPQKPGSYPHFTAIIPMLFTVYPRAAGVSRNTSIFVRMQSAQLTRRLPR
jgi:hypothetical protein